MSNNCSINQSDSINYQGSVNVKLQRGKYIAKEFTIHNAGKSNLFKYLASTITNGSINTSLRPNTIILASNTTAISNPVTTQSPVLIKSEDKQATATIHFVIQFGNISGLSFNKMYLMPSGYTGADCAKNACAEVDTGSVDLTPDTVVIVDWNLIFKE